MVQFMRNSDAFSWQMEADPTLRSTIVTVFLLDRSPDWDQLRDRFDRISRTIPSFRQRVVDTAPPAPPRWEMAPDFDLDYHLRRITLPEPGTFDAVLEMARQAEMGDFDRALPLWEVTVVDGLRDRGEAQSAMVVKLHHSLTDGVGGVEIAMILFDLAREGTDRGPMPEEPTVTAAAPLARWRDAAAYDASVARRAMEVGFRSGPRLAWSFVRRPVGTTKASVEMAASVYRTVRPISSKGSPLMSRRTMVRHLDVHEVPLKELRQAARLSGGSLNDAFVAGVSGALRLYHLKHGADVGDLHVTMPVSLRAEGDDVGGNRITLMRFDVPVDVADPGERIRRTHEKASRVRDEVSLPYTQAIAGALNLVPRWYIGSILHNVDFLASDVPGIPVPVFMGGAEVLMQYAFGPTIGAAVNVTLMSYVSTCALGINVDTGAIPDPDLFHRCLVDSFDEILALAT